MWSLQMASAVVFIHSDQLSVTVSADFLVMKFVFFGGTAQFFVCSAALYNTILLLMLNNYSVHITALYIPCSECKGWTVVFKLPFFQRSKSIYMIMLQILP